LPCVASFFLLASLEHGYFLFGALNGGGEYLLDRIGRVGFLLGILVKREWVGGVGIGARENARIVADNFIFGNGSIVHYLN
jgi:hypothetical protein